jgi:protein-L-isoaspartate(D-aspartate) O-methyltransferase
MHADEREGDRSAEREQMVATQLEVRGIVDQAVLAAMRRVPREAFLPPGLHERAYEDSALPVECGQTISQPFIVARMTELLELTAGQRVLEIGTGTGYQTAVLATITPNVLSVEWHLKLMNDAAERLTRLGIQSVRLRCGDGSQGWPEFAPYDGIIVTAGAPDVPPRLLDQLSPGGRLVCPIGPMDDQTLVRVRRIGTELTREAVLKCRFVRLMGSAGWGDAIVPRI